MKIYNSINDFKPTFRPIITLGTFDGVHIGHKHILNQMNKISQIEKGQSVLITFNPHPRHVLYPENKELKLINTIEEKTEHLKQENLAHLIIQNFTKSFSRKKSINFVRDILVDKLNIGHLVVGHDHQFGRNREGSIEDLYLLSELYNFKITKIPFEDINEVIVSSTKIRKAILAGNIQLANTYLGYHFHFTANVISGTSIGKTIGFPTANLDIQDKLKIIPADGVYVVKIGYKKKQYYGMMNIGVKPTFQAQSRSIEVHIFDFNQDIYNNSLCIYVLSRLRDEIKFNNINELKTQLQEDSDHARIILEKF